MFAGHIGAALAIARAERRINIGAFVLAALGLDALLWIFVLLGIESVTIPADYIRTHLSVYNFPYSHGLAAAAIWSVLAGALTYAASPRLHETRTLAAALVGAAVLSHWLLDVLVHLPELPLAGAGSTPVGLGLWRRMPLALALEALIVAAGLYLYLPASALSTARKRALAALTLFTLVFTVVAMTIAPPPPSGAAMATSSLGAILTVSALAWWIDKDRPSRSPIDNRSAASP